jgi:hypothetical protein
MFGGEGGGVWFSSKHQPRNISTRATLIDSKNKVTRHLHFLAVFGIKVYRVDVPMYFGFPTPLTYCRSPLYIQVRKMYYLSITKNSERGKGNGNIKTSAQDIGRRKKNSRCRRQVRRNKEYRRNSTIKAPTDPAAACLKPNSM